MIEVKNLSCTCADEEIFENVSFSVKNGTIFAITGPNGCGKTTLVKTLAGILKATKGQILINGQDITNSSISDRAKRGLAFSFQHPVLFKGISVQELFEIANQDAKNIDVVCDYLSQVGLCARDYLNREFNSTLSGGERKRLDIAITLAQNAEINVFDEPESGIDMWSFDEISNLFEKLKQQQKCVIIVTHNPQILQKADQVLILGKGNVLPHIGTPKELEKHLKPQKCIKLSNGGAK